MQNNLTPDQKTIAETVDFIRYQCPHLPKTLNGLGEHVGWMTAEIAELRAEVERLKIAVSNDEFNIKRLYEAEKTITTQAGELVRMREALKMARIHIGEFMVAEGKDPEKGWKCRAQQMIDEALSTTSPSTQVIEGMVEALKKIKSRHAPAILRERFCGKPETDEDFDTATEALTAYNKMLGRE